MNYSNIRKELCEKVDEYHALVTGMAKPGKLVRGSFYMTRTASGEYPNITATIGGELYRRRVRLRDYEWLCELIDAHRTYRQNQRRCRVLHREIVALITQMRYEKLYDYEPAEEGALRQVNWEDEHGTKE